MKLTEAFEKIHLGDEDLLADAGPAVLRLKLLEVVCIAQRCDAPSDILEAAQLAGRELKKLIRERPCVSNVDVLAREKVFTSEAFGMF